MTSPLKDRITGSVKKSILLLWEQEVECSNHSTPTLENQPLTGIM